MAFGLSAGAISLIGAGAGLVGSAMSSSAANAGIGAQERGAAEANAAQSQAMARADETQRYIFDTARADNASFLNNGKLGNNRLAYLLGLNPSAGGGAGFGEGGGSSNLTREQLRNQLAGQFTTNVPSGETTSPIWMGDYDKGEDSGMMGGWKQVMRKSTQPAFTSQIDEAGLNSAIETRFGEQERARAAAQAAAQADPAYGSLLRKFGQSDLDSDLVYQKTHQFAQDEGRKGLERQAQASGSMFSGQTLKALQRFGAQTADSYVGGAYNRNTAEKDGIFNKLSGISGAGQAASSQVGQAGQNFANAQTMSGQNYANNIGNTAMGMGNARAASGIASSNNMQSGINGAISAFGRGRGERNSLGNIFGGGGFGTGANFGNQDYGQYF